MCTSDGRRSSSPSRRRTSRLWVALGSVGVDLLLAVAVTSRLRHKIRARTWRAVHWLAYLSWPVALVPCLRHGHRHGPGVGDRTPEVACIAAVVGAAIWSVALAARRKSHALAVRPRRTTALAGVPVKHLSA